MSTKTQKLYTSRQNVLDANTFVGERGRLFYDEPSTISTAPVLRYSDGVTRGGIPLFGNIAGGVSFPANSIGYLYNNGSGNLIWDVSNIYSNANVTSYLTTTNNIQVGDWVFNAGNVTAKNTGEDLSIISNGNGIINVVGEYHVHGASNPTTDPVFRVLTDGQIRLLNPTVDSTSGAIEVIGNTLGNAVILQTTGVMLHITGQQDSPGRIYNDGVNNYAAYIGRRYNGTASNPTPVMSGNIISRVGATPYIGNGTTWPSISTVRIDMVAVQDQTVTNQGNEIQFWATPFNSNSISRILTISNTGIKFSDSTVQSTAAIPMSYLGTAYGVATLGSDSKVIPAQLPAGAVFFKGTWDAGNNAPALSDGVGTSGWEYQANTGGAVNFGHGSITFIAGDFAIYDGTLWQRIPGSETGVTSFNGRTGVVNLTNNDIISNISSSAITNTLLQNSTFTVSPGNKLSGGGTASLGGSLTLGISTSYDANIGATYNTVNTHTTWLGNLQSNVNSYSNANVASYLITNTGNVQVGNLTVLSKSTLGNIGNVKITGGTSGQTITTDGAGNLNWTSTPTQINNAPVTGNTISVDFTNSQQNILLYHPTGAVTISLSNYTTGHQARVLIRFNSTTYTVALGVATGENSATGATSLPINGGGGHNISASSTVQLLYTCFDNTAGNCYVAATYF